MLRKGTITPVWLDVMASTLSTYGGPVDELEGASPPNDEPLILLSGHSKESLTRLSRSMTTPSGRSKKNLTRLPLIMTTHGSF